jgi:hypothetical protein
MWLLLLYIALAGGVGGVVNALINDKGFRMPGKVTVDGNIIFQPGWIGNVVLGAIAAVISWGLYGPLATHVIAGTVAASKNPAISDDAVLVLSSLVGAALVGVAGARWFTNEVDKNLLRAAASKAAGGAGSPDAARRIALARPLQALEIAQAMT